MSRRFILALSLLVFAAPAQAHPGNHSGLALLELVRHYAEPDHMFFLALTVITGIVAYHYGRRVEARARSAVRKPESDRP